MKESRDLFSFIVEIPIAVVPDNSSSIQILIKTMFYRGAKFLKNFFFLICILSFSLYYINFFKSQQTRDKVLYFKETEILFKGFRNLSLENYNQKNELILLVPNENSVKETNSINYILDLTNYNGDCKKLFSILKINNVVLLDIDILKNHKILSNLSNIKRVATFQKLKESSLITFGVHPNSFHKLNEVFFNIILAYIKYL